MDGIQAQGHGHLFYLLCNLPAMLLWLTRYIPVVNVQLSCTYMQTCYYRNRTVRGALIGIDLFFHGLSIGGVSSPCLCALLSCLKEMECTLMHHDSKLDTSLVVVLVTYNRSVVGLVNY